MIPARYDATTSTAEQRIFGLLRSDPGTEDWTVLHSLGLARRGTKPFGEIDFVVLIPNAGVLCLEVKGGRVSCREGVWHTRDRYGKEHALSRSPFLQAREGMFALRHSLERHFRIDDPASSVPVGFAVVFPDVDAPPVTPESEEWQSVDITKLRSPISLVLGKIMGEHRRLLGNTGGLPSPNVLGRIRSFLRPDFESVVARGTTIAQSEERLIRLTEEQFDTIDSLERNERCLVEGPAGTGKTLLALEYARREAADGRHVVLICFNRLLGEWLTEETADISTGQIVAGSFHRALREIILQSSYAEEFRRHESETPMTAAKFDELYPFFGELALAEGRHQADVLIVDEAQDLLMAAGLNVFNSWVSGGLAGGRWAMFGDFTRQAIYNPQLADETIPATEPSVTELPTTRSSEDLRAPLRRQSHFANLLLHLNCRNTRPIGEETALLSGFDSLPYRLERQDSLPVDYRWWTTSTEQEEALSNVLMTLKNEGVLDSSIVILSPRALEYSVAAHFAAQGLVTEVRMRARNAKPGIAFSTVHAFKGLESAVIILCDVDRMTGARAQALLYVAMSRARSHLIVIINEKLRGGIASAVKRRLLRGWET